MQKNKKANVTFCNKKICGTVSLSQKSSYEFMKVNDLLLMADCEWYRNTPLFKSLANEKPILT